MSRTDKDLPDRVKLARAKPWQLRARHDSGCTSQGCTWTMPQEKTPVTIGVAAPAWYLERVLAKPFSYQTADRAAIDARRTALEVMREVDGGYGDPQAWAPAYSEADAQRSDELFDVFLSAEADLQAVDWELGWRGPGACPEPPLRPRRG